MSKYGKKYSFDSDQVTKELLSRRDDIDSVVFCRNPIDVTFKDGTQMKNASCLIGYVGHDSTILDLEVGIKIIEDGLLSRLNIRAKVVGFDEFKRLVDKFA